MTAAATGVPIESRKETALPAKKSINVGKTERWISMAGGAVLAMYGVTRESVPGKAALSILGGYLFYRGQTGHCAVYEALGVNTNVISAVNIEKSIAINRSPEEVYRFWHNFENLPRFMEHLESVKILGNGDRRSHWVASIPGGISFEWDAEMTEDIPNQRISWRSLPPAEVQNEGTVEFRRSAAGGTELMFKASYWIPGVVGAATSKMFQYISEKQLAKELDQFKNLIESAELRRAA